MDRLWLCPNRIVVTAGLLETCDNSSTVIRFHFLNRIHLFLHFLILWTEPLYCFMNFFPFLYREYSSTRNSWALFISHISCIFRIWVSPITFSFKDHSSCGRDCSVRDSIYPWWASSNSCLSSISLLLKLTETIIERFNLKFLLHLVRSCLTKLLTTSAGKSTETSLTSSWPQRRNLLWPWWKPTQLLKGVEEDWVRRFCSTHTNMCWSGTIPALFAESRTVLIPKSSDVDNRGRILKSPEALRPLTLCNCDCKTLTTAICRGLHWYTMRCVHISQRCIPSRQMADSIFEIETTALAHVACAPRESRILFTDLAAAYPCVNHSWIFHVLEKTELPEFICRFLRRIHYDSTRRVEFARITRGQILMAIDVRQGCPASGFLFAMAFRPYLVMPWRCDHSKESWWPGL